MPAPLDLQGTYPAIATPFSGGQVDHLALAKHVEHLIEHGVSGLVPCGTTGEAATMTRDEKRAVIKTVADACAGACPVIAGVGTNCTATTIVFAGDALEAGADALLVVAPYYNKPTQEGLYAHFSAVLEAHNAPVVLYDVPGRTAVHIEVETVARLAQHPKVVALKDATGDMRYGSAVAAACSTKLQLLSGDDFSALSLVAIGGRGVISVVANADPGRTVRMVNAALSGDFATAHALHHELLPLIEALFATTNPIGVKRAVALLGYGNGSVRLPLIACDELQTERLRATMNEMELL